MKEKVFPLRLSPELHRKLKIAAAKEAVTLQEYCLKVLSDRVKGE